MTNLFSEIQNTTAPVSVPDAVKWLENAALENQDMYREWCKSRGCDPYAALEARAFERGRQAGLVEAAKAARKSIDGSAGAVACGINKAHAAIRACLRVKW